MPKCPSCGGDAESPKHRRKHVEPSSDRGGRTVTAAVGKEYWMVLCPSCDAVLGTVAGGR